MKLWWNWHRRLAEGIFRLNLSRGRWTSTSLEEGPLTWNMTRRRGSVRLPFGLGSIGFGRRR